MRVRAVRDYRSQYANPIRLARGEAVMVGERDTEWPAFAWTTTADGNAGWAPVDWLQTRDDGSAVALRDYSAQELDVQAGDTLAVARQLGGWYWCTRADGRSGWLPARDLQPINETTSEETSA
ncbi:SH3 domain-containing protein [Pseudoxanthomonas dokdonensis]|uniref:Peptide-binding protein n=1 Tax=Pseudoxanthomonas dokdonensis TaxID=344882 RepID=A0A0R0CW82_9GAMM|nr:SH3 domain-containing protein [Pseudoxanthomonas dokdonensis]KRG69571.1 peptide-binding protein [Pseudoxanthomonas dokdonensis]